MFRTICYPLFSPEELIPGNEPPAPPQPPAPPRPGRITCDCCGCQLGADGGVLRTSDEAKAMQKASETVKDLRTELATVQAQLAEANAHLETAKKAVEGSVGKGEAHRLFQW